MLFFVSLLVDGILAGPLYALIALAFVVVYKTSRMVNFALGEWAMLGYWMLGLATVLLALCLYAAIVWMVGHSVVWIVRTFKRVFHRNHDA